MYPNALHALLIRDNDLYVPNVGAQPEPAIRFNTNVQYLVGVIDIQSGEETDRTLNVNTQIATEPGAGFNPILDHLFGNDPGCMDASRDGKLFLLVSRGANYVMEATLDNQGKLNIGAPNNVIRYQTGNMPSRDDISENLLRQRLDGLSRRYLRDLRRAAFVDVRV